MWRVVISGGPEDAHLQYQQQQQQQQQYGGQQPPPPPPPSNAGYWPPPQLQLQQPPQPKRSLSDSDCEDLFSEDSKEQCLSPEEGGSCDTMTRKRRRGIIEKRRRDRINNSLAELRRLVPSAFEKQGSAKLEKAEILQLTVEHLRSVHAKGGNDSSDSHRLAMDYHGLGFRECAAEVARYLVSIEGMDVQDPLRLRLMSHLQCFAAQREVASKQAAAAWPGPPTAFAPPPPVAAPAIAPLEPIHYPEAQYYHPQPPTPAAPAPNYPNSAASKPYRPWGAELAY